MLGIIFIALFIFVHNFLEVDIPHGMHGILKKGTNEYITIFNDVTRSYIYTIKVEYDNASFISEKRDFIRANYNDNTFDVLIVDNNLIFYCLMYSMEVDYNGKTNKIAWGSVLDPVRFQTQAYSNDCLVVCTWVYNFETYETRYDLNLRLLKAPYIEFYKEIEIETSVKDLQVELIGLKDYFVFIKINEEEKGKGNITYKFLDFELNLVNTLNVDYEDYLEMYFSKLSNNGKLNEFFFCVLKKEDSSENLDTYKCQVIKYENNALSPKKTIDIPISGYSYSLEKYFFDENKFVFYFYDIYDKDNYFDGSGSNNYINIIQYENQVLSFYKNYQNYKLPKIVHYSGMVYAFHFDFAMFEQGPILIFNQVFYYLQTICVPKTITLKANEPLEFPIEEIIFPGVDPLRFSFEEINDFIKIYKNSTEVRKGEVFEDLDNFTYFLEIKTFFNEIKIKVKIHESDFICDINIDVDINTYISTFKDSKKCFKNFDYDEINNITYSNLYDYFTVNDKRAIEIELIYKNEPREKELEFIIEGRNISCTKNFTKVTCKIPVSMLPELERVHLYSYLSCFNLIDVGWLEINGREKSSIYIV